MVIIASSVSSVQYCKTELCKTNKNCFLKKKIWWKTPHFSKSVCLRSYIKHSSQYQKPWSVSKILCNASYFWLSSRCLICDETLCLVFDILHQTCKHFTKQGYVSITKRFSPHKRDTCTGIWLSSFVHNHNMFLIAWLGSVSYSVAHLHFVLFKKRLFLFIVVDTMTISVLSFVSQCSHFEM